jgi:beta-alanine degradation protein BauB
VPVADGELLMEEPGGGSRTATLKLHVPYARRAGVEHNVINANPFDFAFIEIEHLKA